MTTTDLKKELAKIESTFLGIEDHGIGTCTLTVNYEDGNSQGVGNYTLDGPDGSGERQGTAAGMQMVFRILAAVGVRQWEDLPGKLVYVLSEPSGKVVGIEGVKFGGGSKQFLFADVYAEAF